MLMLLHQNETIFSSSCRHTSCFGGGAEGFCTDESKVMFGALRVKERRLPSLDQFPTTCLDHLIIIMIHCKNIH